MASVLRIQAETFRIRRSSSAEVGAAKASVKMMFPLVLCFLCVLLLIVGPILLKLSNTKEFLG